MTVGTALATTSSGPAVEERISRRTPDLSSQAVQWCCRHGHPVLALRTGDGCVFRVAMTADNAVAFAIT